MSCVRERSTRGILTVMAGLCVKMLKLLLFISTSIPFCLTNNIDINVSPIRKRGTVGSYFGFSVTGMDYGSNSW